MRSGWCFDVVFDRREAHDYNCGGREAATLRSGEEGED
jgi:hypothetical protein